MTHALKCNLKNSNDERAVFDHQTYLHTFGLGTDLYIADNCLSNTNSFSNLGVSYEAPYNYTGGSTEAFSFLAGSNYF